MQYIIAMVAMAVSNAAAQQATRADPADAKASVPAYRYESAFRNYQPYADPQAARWRHLNEEAGRLGGHSGHVKKPGERGRSPSKAVSPQRHEGHK